MPHTHSIAIRDAAPFAYALGDANGTTARSYPVRHTHADTPWHTHRISITIGASMDPDVDAYASEQAAGSTV